MKLDFNDIIEVSMKVLEQSDAAFEWIKQLHALAPKQMATHLLVACELITGLIYGTAHVVRDNLKSIKAVKKKTIILKKSTIYKKITKRHTLKPLSN